MQQKDAYTRPCLDGASNGLEALGKSSAVVATYPRLMLFIYV
jgi:hypothetical protein